MATARLEGDHRRGVQIVEHAVETHDLFPIGGLVNWGATACAAAMPASMWYVGHALAARGAVEAAKTFGNAIAIPQAAVLAGKQK